MGKSNLEPCGLGIGVMRKIYTAMKWINIAKAASRGPGALIRQRLRSFVIKQAALIARRLFPR